MKKFAIISSGGGGFAKAVYFNKKLLANGKFSLLLSDRDCGAYQFFKNTEVETKLVDLSNFKNRDDYEKQVALILDKAGIDFILLNYDRLIGDTLLNKFQNKIFNLHLSLLPLFKGFKAVEKAYESMMLFYGSSFHLVDNTVDGGALLGQVVVPRRITDNFDSFQNILFKNTAIFFIDMIYKILNCQIVEEKNIKIFSEATYGVSMFNPSLSINKGSIDLQYFKK